MFCVLFNKLNLHISVYGSVSKVVGVLKNQRGLVALWIWLLLKTVIGNHLLKQITRGAKVMSQCKCALFFADSANGHCGLTFIL